jgi:murein L,D-transpeptidase YcbB/YkuD
MSNEPLQPWTKRRGRSCSILWHTLCTPNCVIQKISIVLVVFLAGCSFLNGPTRREINELKAHVEHEKTGQIVREIYQGREFRPLWISRGKTTERLQQFFQFVNDTSHGVHTNVERLRTPPSDLIQYDIDVTTALVKHATAIARKDANLKDEIENAIELNSFAQLGERIAPKHTQYARLRIALQGAPADVARQIELNMDRWRKLPDNLGERYVLVNVPSFELEVHDGNQVPLRMRVVVGSNENRTPLFSSAMKYVVFSPYWNIPESIMTKEMLPKILKDPDYATKENLEVVKVSGNHVDVIDPQDVDWANVGASDIQLRQRPGGGNSLGYVKFVFPNPYNVYLHDTPADNLFAKLTRNFSHGCIRVEKPQELAEYVLRDQPEWTPDRIQKAMHAGAERHVVLKEPLPVHILYFTAWVDDDGMLHLEKDIYGYDQQ